MTDRGARALAERLPHMGEHEARRTAAAILANGAVFLPDGAELERLRAALKTLEYEFGLNIDLNPNLMRMWQLTALSALHPEPEGSAQG